MKNNLILSLFCLASVGCISRSPTANATSTRSIAGSLESPQDQQRVAEFNAKRNEISSLLAKGNWKEALSEAEVCQALADALKIDYFDGHYHRAEALLGLERPLEALEEAKLDNGGLTRDVFTKELSLAMIDELTNDDVNRMLRPTIEMFEEETRIWSKSGGRNVKHDGKQFPKATNHTSRIALIHVLRARYLGDSVVMEREAKSALRREHSNCLAAYYVSEALRRQQRFAELNAYLPILATMPGKHGYLAQKKLDAVK